MRIKCLELKAFGPFSNHTLDFSSELPGLHIVYGPNEAGKSSSLRALQALFFGFPVRTDDNFIHPYDQLLVGGCLQGADGRELTFFRRKKSKNSLFDLDDKPLDPACLNPFLHGIEQDLFTTMYGIDHETLVRGGQGILAQQGEVGQALFAAGAGLASLKIVLDELEAEGDGLFRPRGSTQAITALIVEYRDVQAQLKQVTLSSREWMDHQRALDAAADKLEQANGLRTSLSREKRQLERLRQALPYLAQRRTLLEKIAALGDVVLLPVDFGEQRRKLQQREREARNTLEMTVNRLEELADKRTGVSFNQGVLDRAETIEQLHQGLGQYRKAKADQPTLNGMRISCRTDAVHLLKQIRPDLSIDEVEQLRPSLGKRKVIQALGAKHEALIQGVRMAGQQVRTLGQELENVRSTLEKLSAPVDVVRLSNAVLQAQKSGDIDGEITTNRQMLDRAQQGCAAAMHRLGLWSGPVNLIGQLPIPLQETVRRYEEELHSLTEEKRQLQSERGQLEVELKQLAEQLREIEHAAEVPSEGDLKRYRMRRDHGWQLVRRQWLLGEDASAECRDYDPEVPLPEAYEKLVELSDLTADRLYREADRVQKHASLRARVEGIENRLTDLGSQEADADSARAEAVHRWQGIWEPCNITPLPPREMHAWLNGFDKLRFQVEEAEKLAREVDTREVKRRELRNSLMDELLSLGCQQEFPEENLAPVLLFAEDFVRRAHGEQARREALAGKIRDVESSLEAARQTARDADEELKQWRSQWEGAISPLGMGENTLPAEATDFIEILQGCFEKLKEADEFRKRIAGIERDSRNFEAAVVELSKVIAPDLVGLDATQVVSQLKSRLGVASHNQALMNKFAEEADSLDKTIAEARAGLGSLEEQLAEFRQMACCKTDEELNDAEWRSNEFQKLKEKLAEVEVALAHVAEGVPLGELEVQSQAVDPDALPGRIDGLASEIEERLDPEIRHLSETIGREKNELARMDGSGKAAELADASQQALAKIRRLTERFIRVKLAGKILREEIERYRAENQDPILKIASRYFNELTLGSFTRLRTDLDDQGQPVLIGVRPNGAWLQVGGMSSGTRDQLYLALRLATLDWRVQSSEPMPFIVDDILVNFDDKRSAATLKALAFLAEKTQVILFTHHNQILAAAQDLCMKDSVFIHHL